MGSVAGGRQPRVDLGWVGFTLHAQHLRMMSTRWAFQCGSMPRPRVRRMTEASLAIGASAMRC